MSGFYIADSGLTCNRNTYCPLDPFCTECVAESCTTCKIGYKLQGSTLCTPFCGVSDCKDCIPGSSNIII